MNLSYKVRNYTNITEKCMEYLKLSVPSHIIYLYYEFSNGKYVARRYYLDNLRNSNSTKWT